MNTFYFVSSVESGKGKRKTQCVVTNVRLKSEMRSCLCEILCLLLQDVLKEIWAQTKETRQRRKSTETHFRYHEWKVLSMKNRKKKERWTWTFFELVHHLSPRWRNRVVQSIRFLKTTSTRVENVELSKLFTLKHSERWVSSLKKNRQFAFKSKLMWKKFSLAVWSKMNLFAVSFLVSIQYNVITLNTSNRTICHQLSNLSIFEKWIEWKRTVIPYWKCPSN